MHFDRLDPDQYCPNYCEENIWRLCAKQAVPAGRVLIISNARQRVALWRQISQPQIGLPVIWDYHVVWCVEQAGRWFCYDYDTTLSAPTSLSDYLRQSFPRQNQVPYSYRPRFKSLAAEHYLALFSSDRSHMHNGAKWLSPPPPWPPIGDGRHLLPALIDMGDNRHGSAFTLPELMGFFGLPPTPCDPASLDPIP